MKIRFLQDETIKLLNKRDEFIYDNKYTLSNIHCCLIILIKNNIDQKQDITQYQNDLNLLDGFKSFLSLNNTCPPLVMDMDKLEHSVSSAERRNANKSLDYCFVVNDTSKNKLFSLIGDFKFNRQNITQPYKDLEKKTTCSEIFVKKFEYPIYEKVYIVYPSSIFEELRHNLNRRRNEEENRSKLERFEFISLSQFLKIFGYEHY
ncbi:hypothetical protein BKG95_08530 [Rodentibacter pneumotropicus]|uniref:hypothetical protein n=1 Tax=Rodentibacter pneumotropicus TaxID=758 RepID=UPI0009CC2B3E|nr:hypothetical protein [Rodentibacter pneumotropicus]OOF67086.1 hypothetical protein BKG95_08530 [Rodentibacter pneumotropicus]